MKGGKKYEKIGSIQTLAFTMFAVNHQERGGLETESVKLEYSSTLESAEGVGNGFLFFRLKKVVKILYVYRTFRNVNDSYRKI